MLKHNGWTVVDKKPVKVWWDDDFGTASYMKAGEAVAFESVPHMFGSRQKARESIWNKPKDPNMNMDAFRDEAAQRLRIPLEPYDTLNERVIQALDDHKDRMHRMDTMLGEKGEKLQSVEWQLQDSKMLLRDRDERLLKSISLDDHGEQVKQLTLALHQANITIRALELKAEALHCHQVMLAAQREQLRKQLAKS